MLPKVTLGPDATPHLEQLEGHVQSTRRGEVSLDQGKLINHQVRRAPVADIGRCLIHGASLRLGREPSPGSTPADKHRDRVGARPTRSEQAGERANDDET